MINQRYTVKAALSLALPLATLTGVGASAEPWKNVGEFEDASMIVETNATDGDTEILIQAKPLTDLGLKRFHVFSPHWRQVAEVEAPARSRGIREIKFETPEPENGQILANYPEGTYLYFGVATNGQRFVGSAELSHAMPGATVVIAPAADQVVPVGPLSVQWAAVPDAAEYLLEIQNESTDPEQTLTVTVPRGTTNFIVPASFMVPGSDYQAGVATVGENGNIVFVEVAFSTSE